MKTLWLTLSILAVWIGLTREEHKRDSYRAVNTGLDKFLFILDSLDIKYPEVVLAQAIHETGMFKSKIYRENHNMFGMKESSRKYDIGTKNGHANYYHVAHSGECNYECYIENILDYRDWQRQMMPLNKISSNEDYIWYLQNGRPSKYAEDLNYEKKVTYYYKIICSIRSSSSLPEQSSVDLQSRQ